MAERHYRPCRLPRRSSARKRCRDRLELASILAGDSTVAKLVLSPSAVQPTSPNPSRSRRKACDFMAMNRSTSEAVQISDSPILNSGSFASKAFDSQLWDGYSMGRAPGLPWNRVKGLSLRGKTEILKIYISWWGRRPWPAQGRSGQLNSAFEENREYQ